MYVNWEAFIDVEEFGNGPNPTGIMDYTVGIGKSNECFVLTITH